MLEDSYCPGIDITFSSNIMSTTDSLLGQANTYTIVFHKYGVVIVMHLLPDEA